jgi:hypothetical protein
MERAEYDRHSRARMAETAKGGVETCNALQRRTRRSASTIGGAAPHTIIGRADADRAGARPYRAIRCENASNVRRRIAPLPRLVPGINRRGRSILLIISLIIGIRMVISYQ